MSTTKTKQKRRKSREFGMLMIIPDGYGLGPDRDSPKTTNIRFTPDGRVRKLRKPVTLHKDGKISRNGKVVGRWLERYRHPECVINPAKMADPREIERVRWKILCTIRSRLYPRRVEIMKWAENLAPDQYKDAPDRFISLLLHDHDDKDLLDQIAHIETGEEGDMLAAYQEIEEQLRRYWHYVGITSELLMLALRPYMPERNFKRHYQPPVIVHFTINGRDYPTVAFFDREFSKANEFWAGAWDAEYGDTRYRRVDLDS